MIASRRILSAAAALAAGSLLLSAPAFAQPGYHCVYRKDGAFGRLSADFEIPRDGQASIPAYLRWEAPRGDYRAPWVSAAFYRMADGHYRIDNGYASIAWQLPIPLRRTLTLSVQLRSRPEPPIYTRTALAGDYERTGGPIHLSVDWSDFAAFARGATELHLVAVDRHRRLVATAPVDRALVALAEPQIRASLAELEDLVADPAPRCEFLEDLRSNDVVVTTAH